MGTHEFLLFGASVWFWVAFGILLICLLIAEKQESGTFATLSFAAFVGVSYQWGNAMAFLKFFFAWEKVVIYLVIGFIYCLFRFYLWGREVSEEVEKMKEYATSKKVDYPLSEAHLENYQNQKSSYDEIKTKDKVNRIIRWWLNWPASLLWWVLSDFIRNLGTRLYHFFGGVFDKMFMMGQKSVKK